MASSASISSPPAAVVKIFSAASAGRRSTVSIHVHNLHYNHSKLIFPLRKVHWRQSISSKKCPKIQAQSDEAVGSHSNDGSASKLPLVPMPEEAISEFLAQVATLVKLVDSRDVSELKLKKLNCELIIRKKEALPQPPTSAQPPYIAPIAPHYVQPPSDPITVAASLSPSSPPSPSKPSKSSHPPLKSPMAGTFYRSSGPGAQPYAKVGDQIKKGQILCIVEAMKLMNEIESDQAGILTEILAEDGKPVTIDQPLFIIEP